MLISIITINYNELEGLSKTMQSVFEQTYTSIEYIVIDGNSTDGSKEYVENNADKLDYWVSEPDKGIYNAMNKGIKVANGEYLLFLNSGDSFYDKNILLEVSKQFLDKRSIYYCNVQRFYRNGDAYIKKYPKELSFGFFVDSTLPHQGTFIKKTLFNNYMYYNENYLIASDWEFWICLICKFNVSYKHIDLVISNFGMDGISNEESGKLKAEQERLETYNKYFPLFYKEYLELLEKEKVLNSSKVQLFLKIDKSKFLSTINYAVLKVLNEIIVLRNRLIN